jgi:3-deoxy-7-phosphoheptulonate synthase
VADALGLLRAAGLPERLVIDASHGNSGKDHRRQGVVAAQIADQVRAGNSEIVGVMLESFLVEGRQDLQPGRQLRYGQSITDACIGWEATVEALDALAGAVRSRRNRTSAPDCGVGGESVRCGPRCGSPVAG